MLIPADGLRRGELLNTSRTDGVKRMVGRRHGENKRRRLRA